MTSTTSPVTVPYTTAAQDKEGVFAAENPTAARNNYYAISFITDEAKFAAAEAARKTAPQPKNTP